MTTLAAAALTVCRKTDAPLPEADQDLLLGQLPGWNIRTESGIPHLSKTFTFSDYAGAATFTQQVAALAEQANHHPAILLEWGKVTISWWTHTIRGLHRNDFIMAARCEVLVTA